MRGILNPANFNLCAFNVVAQLFRCLLTVSLFNCLFQQIQHKKVVAAGLLHTLVELSFDPSSGPLAAPLFTAAVKKTLSQFRLGGHHDVTELLENVIAEVPTLSREFESVWSVEKRCKDCGASTEVYDAETVIRVQAANNSIEDQLENLMEWTDAGVCATCGGDCQKRRAITALSSNLSIHISRFNDDGTKSTASLDYAETLDIACPGEARGSKLYELKAVVINPGGDNGTGHFFGSFFEPLEERWYVCDDDKVTLSEGPRLSDQDAVLLVYQVGVGAGVLSGGV
jgi:hypothetical protein